MNAVAQPFWWPLPALAGPAAKIEALVDGQVMLTSHGQFFLRRTSVSLDTYYGNCRLGDFLHLERQAAAALSRSPGLAEVIPERMLFLDTETTGLAGGTGTHAFLVGLGHFERLVDSGGATAGSGNGEVQFVLSQCLMRSYAEERAMLSWLAERLDGFDALATFNGRTFDVPLLQTRFLMSRLRVDLEAWLQFDLLPPARRLWRGVVQSCALQNLERHILGVQRQDDIESYLIPGIYYQYLRDGDGRYLQRVFNHNRADILALLALAIRACAAFGTGSAHATRQATPGWSTSGVTGGGLEGGQRVSSPGWPNVHPVEYVGLGRVYEQLGNVEAAEHAYRMALGRQLPRGVRSRTLFALAALLKRAGRYAAAVELWQMLVDEAPAQSVAALVELAKYWEHRRNDPARAHALVVRARDCWLAAIPAPERSLPGLGSIGSGQDTRAAARPDNFARRLARLERKRDRPRAGEAQPDMVSDDDT